MTDIKRWSDDGSYDHGWHVRTANLFDMIPPHSKTILEFGAGTCYTSRLLKPGQVYTPSDLVSRDDYCRGCEPTIVMDLNNDPWTITDKYDVVMFSGVLEYIEDMGTLVRNLSGITDNIVCSFSDTTNDTRSERNGWVNRISQHEFLRVFEKYGFELVRSGSWSGQQLYLLIKNYDH